MAGRLLAAPTGPILHFDYGASQPQENPLDKFMYFVPLISPDPIAVSTNAGNTQSARGFIQLPDQRRVLPCHLRI